MIPIRLKQLLAAVTSNGSKKGQFDLNPDAICQVGG
jgi:hypothetical protein